MNLSQAKNKITKQEWYHQGGAVKPLYISYPWHACSYFTAFGKKIPIKYNVIANNKNDFMDDYISTESLKKVTLYYYQRQLKDQRFVANLWSNWNKKLVRPYLQLVKDILAQDLSKMTAKDLVRLFEKFTEIYLDVWHDAIFLDGFDYYGETVLADVLKKESKIISDQDLGILLIPPYPSFIQQQRLELLGLAEKVIKDKKAVRFLVSNSYAKVGNKYPWLKNSLVKLSNNFYWLHNDFSSVDYLKSDHYYRELIALLKDGEKMVKEREMKRDLSQLKNKRDKIIRKLKLSKDSIAMISALALLGNFRDSRKSYNQMAGNVIKKIVKELSARTGLAPEKIENLFHWEMRLVLSNKKKVSDLNKKRLTGLFCFLSTSIKDQDFFYGQQARELNNLVKNIISSKMDFKGRIAFPGVVKGIVKIIKDKKDFHKMKKGDILVAPNTRPEYVPVMKIAGAIVTDEGGMTCHAAIVSRELKIPCVVGVQGATTRLKDGDLVEVDADKGVVKVFTR